MVPGPPVQGGSKLTIPGVCLIISSLNTIELSRRTHTNDAAFSRVENNIFFLCVNVLFKVVCILSKDNLRCYSWNVQPWFVCIAQVYGILSLRPILICLVDNFNYICFVWNRIRLFSLNNAHLYGDKKDDAWIQSTTDHCYLIDYGPEFYWLPRGSSSFRLTLHWNDVGMGNGSGGLLWSQLDTVSTSSTLYLHQMRW